MMNHAGTKLLWGSSRNGSSKYELNLFLADWTDEGQSVAGISIWNKLLASAKSSTNPCFKWKTEVKMVRENNDFETSVGLKQNDAYYPIIYRRPGRLMRPGYFWTLKKYSERCSDIVTDLTANNVIEWRDFQALIDAIGTVRGVDGEHHIAARLSLTDVLACHDRNREQGHNNKLLTDISLSIRHLSLHT
ncbi:hypothetical protein KIN20_033472 [Parelaphostrongylus tenuis]|uniref:Uncharacterized protein n=1 Tax=Parelaphostrongylus tenuis TaxID=148309 RepID=A0AAD5R8F5_PARTN|nr:hypothetical protein KIN20_033472 [Parelaphostrongylus tenuis]